MRVMLERGGDRTLDLPERGIGGVGHLCKRATERLGHEAIGILAQSERAGLARRAHNSPCRSREANEVLVLAAARARAQMRGEARGEQQLQAKRKRRRPAANGDRRSLRRYQSLCRRWRLVG